MKIGNVLLAMSLGLAGTTGAFAAGKKKAKGHECPAGSHWDKKKKACSEPEAAVDPAAAPHGEPAAPVEGAPAAE